MKLSNFHLNFDHYKQMTFDCKITQTTFELNFLKCCQAVKQLLRNGAFSSKRLAKICLFHWRSLLSFINVFCLIIIVSFSRTTAIYKGRETKEKINEEQSRK